MNWQIFFKTVVIKIYNAMHFRLYIYNSFIHNSFNRLLSLILHSTDVSTASQSTFEGTMRVLDTTETEVTAHPVAAEYPQTTLNGTPTCSCPIGSVLYKTHVASL